MASVQAAEQIYREARAAYFREEGDWEAVLTAWNQIAEASGEYGGAPMPIDDIGLVMEPRSRVRYTTERPVIDKKKVHAKAEAALKKMRGMNKKEYLKAKAERSRELDKRKAWSRRYNRFFSRRLSRWVEIWGVWDRNKRGRKLFIETEEPWLDRYRIMTRTFRVSFVWSPNAERTAVQTLKGLISKEQFDTYTLTGCFAEKSKKSNVTYWFRKSKPTIAISRNGHILAALCMHPIAFYEYTFAGAMVPTDDVIAHLLMMRGQEKKFWSKANHHMPWMVTSGI